MSLSNIKDKIRELTAYIRKMTKPHSIQMTISISFTILSICSMAFLGVTLYRQFSNRAEAMTIESTGQLLNQTAINLEDYLRNMRRISDTMYYSVIKNKDLASDTMDEEMNLLYEANKDNLISIACYTGEGQLVAAVPVANEKSQGKYCEAAVVYRCGRSDGKPSFFDTACAESVWRSILPLLLGRILKPCRGADK